jgi:anti-sigma factor RsiW
MKDCVRYAPMIGAREGELPADEARALADHLAACAACRAREADVRATDGLVADALLAHANRRDFAPFVDGVMARIEMRRHPRGALGRLRRMVSLHPRLTFGAAAAPIVAALAILVYVRVDRHPELASVLELDSEGVTTIVQTNDGPVVLLPADDDPEGS